MFALDKYLKLKSFHGLNHPWLKWRSFTPFSWEFFEISKVSREKNLKILKILPLKFHLLENLRTSLRSIVELLHV